MVVTGVDIEEDTVVEIVGKVTLGLVLPQAHKMGHFRVREARLMDHLVSVL